MLRHGKIKGLILVEITSAICSVFPIFNDELDGLLIKDRRDFLKPTLTTTTTTTSTTTSTTTTSTTTTTTTTRRRRRQQQQKRATLVHQRLPFAVWRQYTFIFTGRTLNVNTRSTCGSWTITRIGASTGRQSPHELPHWPFNPDVFICLHRGAPLHFR